MSSPERVAIIHYHLRGGGVTRVIEHIVKTLGDRNIRSAVICGEMPRQAPVPNIIINDKLAYNQVIRQNEISHFFHELERSITEKLGGKPDLWHIHNHNLGKNQVLPLLVNYMANQGIPLVLQIHDFPEDGRPKNYQYLSHSLLKDNPDSNLGKILYPTGNHIFYGTLNDRDYQFLSNAGIPSEQIKLIPNAINLPETAEKQKSQDAFEEEYDRLILYPTRAIRRKNIGEFLLHALLSQQNDLFAITLAPKNPKAKPVYERWRSFSDTLHLPVKFEAGKQSDFSYPELLKASDLIMTTSIAEGFGLAFLEPWLIGNKIYGRNLPEITRDFETKGIRLSTLYNRLNVPLEWLPENILREKIERALQRVYQQYNKKLTGKQIDKAYNYFVDENHMVDFGRLDEPLQEQIILILYKNPELKVELSGYQYTNHVADEDVIQKNRRIIQEKYNLDHYGEQLVTIYSSLLEQKPDHVNYIDADALLDQFLNPERFNLLRT